MGSNRLRPRPDRLTRPSAVELAKRYGLLRLRDLEPLGVPRTALRLTLKQVAPGIWAQGCHSFSKTTIAAKCVPQGVVCLSSALYFHGLLPEEPPEVWLAIAEKARRPVREQPPLHIVRFSGAALVEGVELHEDRGVPIRVYSVAKTVADLFKYRNKLGYPVAIQALQTALLAGCCTLEEIRHFAAICRVTRSVAPYLEVLLARRGADIQAALSKSDEARAGAVASLNQRA